MKRKIIEIGEEATIGLDGETTTAKEGEMIIMPANIPHDVQAAEQPFKMLLTMIRSET